MSLRDRLEYLNFGHKTERPGERSQPPDDRAPTPGEKAAGGASPPRWLARFESKLGGRHEPGPSGEVHVVRREHAGGHSHGARRLDEFLALSPAALGLLGRDPALAEAEPESFAFLDCETTGLAGGTGTKAFLVGIAYFERGGLVVEQHFLPDYDGERAFLAGIDATVSRFDALATFNGKSFDLPLLDTRLTLGRQRADWLDLPHLDLLHPARRVWRRRLESCNLASLEEGVLGLARQDDVPGWLIPTLYFGFLRTGNLRPLEPVFEHNRWDLLSLVALAVRLARLVTGEEEPEHPVDRLSLGRLLEERGEVERGIVAYERALAGGLGPAEREEARVRIGLLCKRLRHDAKALATWESLALAPGGRSVFALLELAKHYEHRARDYARAAEVTRRALVAVGLRSELAADGGDLTIPALEKRLRRVEAKQRKAGTTQHR